jgi:hypothetical protein
MSTDRLTTIQLDELLEVIQNVVEKYRARFDLEYTPRYTAVGVKHPAGWKAVIGSLESTEEPGVSTVTRRVPTLRDAVHHAIVNLMHHLPEEELLAPYRFYETSDAEPSA